MWTHKTTGRKGNERLRYMAGVRRMKKKTLQTIAGYAVMSAFWMLFGYCLLMWWTT